MAKKIAKLTNPADGRNRGENGGDTAAGDLVNQALAITEPPNYYQGRRLTGGHLPDNILLFVRNADKYLGTAERRSFHNRNVLLIPLSGHGRIIVNARAYALEPGTCLHIAPYQFHHYSDVQREGLCWLFVTFERIAQSDAQGGICRPSDAGAFAEDLQQLIRAYSVPQTPDTTLQLACRLSLLLANLQRQGAARTRQLEPSRAEDLLLRVHALLSANLSRPLSIADLSRELGMSESSLRSRFRNASGHSLGSFQQTLRLQHAALLLSQTQRMSVSQVATDCGWESPYSFSRAFSAYWGLPPKKFALQVEGT